MFCLVFWISGSREYSEDTLKLACDYQANLSADFGGTEILQPLRAIYNKPPMTTHSRQVADSTVYAWQLVWSVLCLAVSYEHFICSFLLFI